ncbi:MAG: DUF4180 domain-containing protein [Bacteroidota bacterium]
MNIEVHGEGAGKIVEVVDEVRLINNAEEGLQILVDLYYQDFDKVILHEHHFTPDFFNLKTGLAGEILQKYSNFKVQLCIVGDFSKYDAPSIKSFIYESNNGTRVNFLPTLVAAIEKLK